jgi:membrane associated rhomboid family serine protease
VVYGFFGFLWVLQRRDPRFADAMDDRTAGLFVAWFFLCILLTVSQVLRVGNVAHASGAAIGALVGAHRHGGAKVATRPFVLIGHQRLISQSLQLDVGLSRDVQKRPE